MCKARRVQPIWTQKHRDYILRCRANTYNIAEGAVRAGKTIDNIMAFAWELERTADKLHLASGSTGANAKLNIGDANGFGLEHIFRGRCRWGKYKGNEALFVRTRRGMRYVLFAGGGFSDSYKRIRGNAYGLWIATEINLHHETFIQEAFNRQGAARARKVFWDLNPVHPKAQIYTEYIDKYRERSKAGAMLGGVNYEHFTIFDNMAIPEEQLAEFVSQREPGSVWYRRDIMGERCAAEGLIYRQFADNVSAYMETGTAREVLAKLQFCTIGVDFGGSKSAHSFTCTGIWKGFTGVTVLDEFYTTEELTPDKLTREFVRFVQKQTDKGFRLVGAYADSAEQVLIRGLQNGIMTARVGLRISNAQKMPINDRIRFWSLLMAAQRMTIMPHCKHTIDALCNAVWDDSKPEDVRLDNGTTNIDSLDSKEYSVEPYQKTIQQMVARGAK